MNEIALAPLLPSTRIRVYNDLIQGSDEWLAARCGLLTASNMKLIVTQSLRPSKGDRERMHLYELMAQRITGYVEPVFVNDDMLRGHVDEVKARALYNEYYAPVEEVGFITNDKWGFTIGYSPDGLVGSDGAIECKSRRQKYQAETIVNMAMPDDYVVQVQTGLLVSEREWIDFISYSGGMPMVVIRVYPDPKIQDAILEAAGTFEARLAARFEQYKDSLASGARLIPTQREIEQEMYF